MADVLHVQGLALEDVNIGSHCFHLDRGTCRFYSRNRIQHEGRSTVLFYDSS